MKLIKGPYDSTSTKDLYLTELHTPDQFFEIWKELMSRDGDRVTKTLYLKFIAKPFLVEANKDNPSLQRKLDELHLESGELVEAFDELFQQVVTQTICGLPAFVVSDTGAAKRRHFFEQYFNVRAPNGFLQLCGEAIPLQQANVPHFPVPNCHVEHSSIDCVHSALLSKGFTRVDTWTGPTQYSCGDPSCPVVHTFPRLKSPQYVDSASSSCPTTTFIRVLPPPSDTTHGSSDHLQATNYHLWNAAAGYVGYVLTHFNSPTGEPQTISQCISRHVGACSRSHRSPPKLIVYLPLKHRAAVTLQKYVGTVQCKENSYSAHW